MLAGQKIVWQEPTAIVASTIGDSSEHTLDLSSVVDVDTIGVIFSSLLWSPNAGICRIDVRQNAGGTMLPCRAQESDTSYNWYSAANTFYMPLSPTKTITYQDVYNIGQTLSLYLYGQVKRATGITGGYALVPISVSDGLVLSGGNATSRTRITTQWSEAIGFLGGLVMVASPASGGSGYPHYSYVYVKHPDHTSSYGCRMEGKLDRVHYEGRQFIIPAKNGEFDYAVYGGGDQGGAQSLYIHLAYAIIPVPVGRIAPRYALNDIANTTTTLLTGGYSNTWAKVATGLPPGSLAVLTRITSDGAYPQSFLRGCTMTNLKDIYHNIYGYSTNFTTMQTDHVVVDNNGDVEYRITEASGQLALYLKGHYPPA